MKLKNFLFFFSFSIFGFQNPICHITEFPNTQTKSISFGTYSLATEHCNFFFNSPAPGQVQIACYVPNNPIPAFNAIATPANPGFPGGWDFPDGQMTWIIKSGEFHLVGAASDRVEVKLDGVF